MAPRQSGQQGVVLLEALIGILIFSLGVLALVAMQAVSVSNVSNARYRSEASFLANEIISQIWVDRGVNYANVNGYKVSGGTGGNAPSIAWVKKVNTLLPGSTDFPPEVAIVDATTDGKQVTVTIRWKAPDAVTVSNHTAVAFVSDP